MSSRKLSLKKQTRTFVSFASLDHIFVRKLLARLQALGFEAWDYSDEEQELSAGSEVLPSLAERLDLADICIVVISRHALKSRFCKHEVRHALALSTAGRLKLFPIVCNELKIEPSSWPTPYSALASIVYQRVDFSSVASVELALKRLCDDVERSYQPPIIGDERLPFMQRFIDELDEVTTARSGRQGRENGIYRRLMLAQHDVENSVSMGNYQRGIEVLDFILRTCEYEFPTARLYYPYITRAVFQLATGLVYEAVATLRALTTHPRQDENFWGLFGYIWHYHGQYEAALKCYERALDYAPGDAALRAHVSVHRMVCGRPVDVQGLLEVNMSTIPSKRDRQKFLAVRAMALAYTERVTEAYAALLGLITADPADIETGLVIQFAEILRQHGQPTLAVKLLDIYYPVFADDIEFLEYRAQRSLEEGQAELAATFFKKLDVLHPYNNLRYQTGLAIACWLLGDTKQVQDISSRVLNVGSSQASTSDSYYTGWANWFLGRYDRAQYDFEKSKRPPTEHYKVILENLQRKAEISFR